MLEVDAVIRVCMPPEMGLVEQHRDSRCLPHQITSWLCETTESLTGNLSVIHVTAFCCRFSVAMVTAINNQQQKNDVTYCAQVSRICG
jgi:hypothetical protein